MNEHLLEAPLIHCDKTRLRRKFDEARKAQPAENATGGHARVALEMIRELYLVERAL